MELASLTFKLPVTVRLPFIDTPFENETSELKVAESVTVRFLIVARPPTVKSPEAVSTSCAYDA